ncbi:MAG: lysophospholipase [Candidatus Obscuribacterales bacterium]|nr:lysophospholipase [Candidatus Obscuribacterales bacterium]
MNFTEEYSEQPQGSDDTEWLSCADGSKLFVRCWQAEMPLATVLYLHGIEGHSLWFKETAEFLQDRGISILAVDRRGSGMSQEKRGDCKNWQVLIDDTRVALNFAKQKAGSNPLFLMANCWGAKLASILAQEQCPESKYLAGLIFSSPAIEVKVDLPLRQKLEVAWGLLFGPGKNIPIPLKIEDFTDNQRFLEFISSDKLRLVDASPRFFFSTAILSLMSKQTAEKISLPTLLVQSGIDSIVDIDRVKSWYNRLSSSDKTMQIFPGILHSLDFDSNPAEYRNLLLDWICKHSNSQRSEFSRENSLA